MKFPDSAGISPDNPVSGSEILFTESSKIYLVGIKGTGMTALAEILHIRGHKVTGTDVEEVFYTDSILEALNIPFFEGFSSGHITPDIELVIYSAAYSPGSNPELAEVLRAGIPMMEYTQALGELSRDIPAAAVSGVHGKTTTTALAGALIKSLNLPGTVLVGSGVAGFGNRSTLILGDEFLVAETCEYRRHFLRYHPDLIVLTSIEPDHLDYFKDYNDILSAFLQFAGKLPPGGTLIYCADEAGASEAAEAMMKIRKDILYIPYGFSAKGDFRVIPGQSRPGMNFFSLAGWPGEFSLSVPGEHTILNAAAALALISRISSFPNGRPSSDEIELLKKGLAEFRGSRRRSEILGEADGILFMDDYAHHPSAVKTTLKGFREFYPDRRLVVDFMSHTYSRTVGLFEEFSKAFPDADVLILHKIYGSAREIIPEGGVSGYGLFERIKEERGISKSGDTRYFHEVEEAMEFLSGFLKPGDLFLTMGAGNNWILGRNLYDESAKLMENKI